MEFDNFNIEFNFMEDLPPVSIENILSVAIRRVTYYLSDEDVGSMILVNKTFKTHVYGIMDVLIARLLLKAGVKIELDIEHVSIGMFSILKARKLGRFSDLKRRSFAILTKNSYFCGSSSGSYCVFNDGKSSKRGETKDYRLKNGWCKSAEYTGKFENFERVGYGTQEFKFQSTLVQFKGRWMQNEKTGPGLVTISDMRGTSEIHGTWKAGRLTKIDEFRIPVPEHIYSNKVFSFLFGICGDDYFKKRMLMLNGPGTFDQISGVWKDGLAFQEVLETCHLRYTKSPKCGVNVWFCDDCRRIICPWCHDHAHVGHRGVFKWQPHLSKCQVTGMSKIKFGDNKNC